MEINRDEWFGFIRWLNFMIGFMNIYFFINSGGYPLLALGMLNIAVWVFTRRQ